MLDFGAVSFEWAPMFMQLFVLLPVLLFYAFIIYSITQVLRFMKTKLELDRERNQKLEQILEKSRDLQR